jgi:MFS family permease
MAIGAGFGGWIMQSGRRRSILIICTIGGLGVSMTLVSITRFKLLLCGRLIAGFCDGVLAATVPRYIEEYLPLSYYTLGSLIFTCSANAGSLIALFDGLVLPHEQDINY